MPKPGSRPIHAWSRLFALFALALLVVVSLAIKLLVPGAHAVALLRRVASRRRGRWDLSLVSAMVRLLQEDRSVAPKSMPSARRSEE